MKNVVFCDGGLSNRLNTLIFALILKEKFNLNWEISWPINNWCGARFESLFSTSIPVNQNTLISYKEREDLYCLALHENQCHFNEQNINYHTNLNNFEDYHNLLSSEKPIFYYHNLIPQIASIADIKMALNNISVNNEVFIAAKNFCIQHEIDDTVLGLHIRKTDFGNTVNDEELYEIVKKSPKKFFVCSDDQEVNLKFSHLPNCSVFSKKNFPSKMKTGKGWNENTIDDQGREFFFNIERSEASIVEALVDLLILSKTTHLNTSHSTFLKMSMIFKATNFIDFDKG